MIAHRLGNRMDLASAFAAIAKRYNIRRRTVNSGWPKALHDFMYVHSLGINDGLRAWDGTHSDQRLNALARKFRAEFWRQPANRSRLLPRMDIAAAMRRVRNPYEVAS